MRIQSNMSHPVRMNSCQDPLQTKMPTSLPTDTVEMGEKKPSLLSKTLLATAGLTLSGLAAATDMTCIAIPNTSQFLCSQ